MMNIDYSQLFKYKHTDICTHTLIHVTVRVHCTYYKSQILPVSVCVCVRVHIHLSLPLGEGKEEGTQPCGDGEENKRKTPLQ